MKYLRIVALCGLVLAIPACATDKLIGVTQDPKTGVVTIDPNGGTLGTIAKDAGAAAPIVPAPFNVPLLAGSAVLSLIVHVWQQIRAGNWKNAAIATATGVGAVANTLPADVQAKLGTAISIAHDAANVAQSLQDNLQATASGHPAAA